MALPSAGAPGGKMLDTGIEPDGEPDSTSDVQASTNDRRPTGLRHILSLSSAPPARGAKLMPRRRLSDRRRIVRRDVLASLGLAAAIFVSVLALPFGQVHGQACRIASTLSGRG